MKYLMKTLLITFVITFLITKSGIAIDKKQLSYQCYKDGVSLYKNDKREAALQKFREAVKYDKKLAKAYEYIALILMEYGSVHSRFIATAELEKALKLDWNNPEFRYTNATLYLKKDMAGAAMKEFEKVVKYDPENYMAYYQMGLIKEKIVMRYRDMIDADEGGVIYFRKFAEKDKAKTIYYYNKARAINPRFMDVYYRLGLLYYEFEDIDEMISILSSAVVINPDDKNCHLFLGFAFHNNQQYELAMEQYRCALELMAGEERVLFESIEQIITPQQQEKYATLATAERRDMENAHWKKNDPLFLTKYNERKLEHYSRIAYANLRYSIPGKKVEGWKTDQGKVYVRYGKPKAAYRTRPEIGDFSAINSFSPLKTSKDVWIYNDFEFVFDDQFLSNRYEFAWGDSPENDYRSVYELLIKKTPELHNYISENKLLEIAADISEFEDIDDKIALEMNYAVHADSIYLIQSGDSWRSRLKKGVFVFDRHWDEILAKRQDVNLPEGDIVSLGDSKYFIINDKVRLSPGLYKLALEVHDLESGRRGSLRWDLDVKLFDKDSLELSDILLARHIEPDSGVYQFYRDSMQIVSNPLRRFVRAEPVYIYYEIYNLLLDEAGLSRFRIDYTLGDGEDGGPNLIRKLLSRLNIVKIHGDITTTLMYEGNSAKEYLYQKIDLPSEIEAELSLTVRITDLHSGASVSKKAEFKLE